MDKKSRMGLRRWLEEVSEAERPFDPWWVTWPTDADSSSLEIRINHTVCSRFGLGLRWDLIARLPATITVDEARAEILRLRRERFPIAAKPEAKAAARPKARGRSR